MKVFIIHTTHNGYDEYDTYVVIAESETQAKELTMLSKEFRNDKLGRLRKTGQVPWGNSKISGWYKTEDLPSLIESVKEVPLDKARVVLSVYNPG